MNVWCQEKCPSIALPLGALPPYVTKLATFGCIMLKRHQEFDQSSIKIKETQMSQ